LLFATRRTSAEPGGGSGFTLIELLAVIAIMAILAALVLSATGKAMQSAKAAHCRNNLKQWSCAFLMYAQDNETIPREGHEPNGQTGQDSWMDVKDSASVHVWYNALSEYLAKGASSYDSDRPSFYRDKLFHCPAARFIEGVGEDPLVYFSLAMNSKLILPVPPTYPPVYSIKSGSIQEPANTVAFLDERVNSAEPNVDRAQIDISLGQPSAFASRFAARHGLNGNLALCDGHVATWRGDRIVETRLGSTRGKAIFPGEVTWCADPLVPPN
jgi:prepilin-type N-terminal cleavage/methylation domain-containing protein/prepilin-type processing-associated H-X9-DG protein